MDAVPVPLREWKTDAARQFADIISLHDDLTFVVQACERLVAMADDDDRDIVIARALWNAALVTYSRCWDTGVRVGLRTDLLNNFEGDPIGFHKHLIRMRDKHVAHAVNPFEDVVVGLAISPPGELSTASVGAVGFLVQKLIGWPAKSVTQFGTVAAFLRAEVVKMYERQYEVVLAEARSAKIEEVLALPVATLVTPGPDHVEHSRLRRKDEPSSCSTHGPC
jgi:hypothetical protein